MKDVEHHWEATQGHGCSATSTASETMKEDEVRERQIEALQEALRAKKDEIQRLRNQNKELRDESPGASNKRLKALVEEKTAEIKALRDLNRKLDTQLTDLRDRFASKVAAEVAPLRETLRDKFALAAVAGAQGRKDPGRWAYKVAEVMLSVRKRTD